MTYFLVGSYREKPKNSVDLISFDATKKLRVVGSIDAGERPSFLTTNKDGSLLYAVNELNKTTHGQYGKVVCFKKKGKNYEKISEISTEGNDPCHVLLHEERQVLFVANYSSGSLSVFSLKGENFEEEVKDGKKDERANKSREAGVMDVLVQKVVFQNKSIHPERQRQSHAHQSILDLNGNRLLVSDLGGDKIYVFNIKSKRDGHHIRVQNDVLVLCHTQKCRLGVGPRHMKFDDEGYLYVLGELSSSVMVYRYLESSGELLFLCEYTGFKSASIPLYPRTSAAEIVITDKYVYTSNRGDDSISVFEKRGHGKLAHLDNIYCGGKTPRNFIVIEKDNEDDKLVVANQDSDNLVFFSICISGEGHGLKLLKEDELAVKKPVMLLVIKK